MILRDLLIPIYLLIFAFSIVLCALNDTVTYGVWALIAIMVLSASVNFAMDALDPRIPVKDSVTLQDAGDDAVELSLAKPTMRTGPLHVRCGDVEVARLHRGSGTTVRIDASKGISLTWASKPEDGDPVFQVEPGCSYLIHEGDEPGVMFMDRAGEEDEDAIRLSYGYRMSVAWDADVEMAFMYAGLIAFQLLFLYRLYGFRLPSGILSEPTGSS